MKELDEVLDRIHRTMRQPNWRPQTSSDMRQRAKRLSDYRAAVIVTGGEVKDEYR